MFRQHSQCAPGGTSLRRPERFLLRHLGVLVVTIAAVAAPAVVDVTAAAAAGQSITAPTTGAAGGLVAIGGAGWPAFDRVNIYLLQGSTSTYFCGLSADSTGTLLAADCTLPDLTAGKYTVTSSDGTLTASAPAKGFTLTPGVTLSNTNGTVVTTSAVGDTVDLTGNGFTGLSKITKVTVGTTVVGTTPAAPATSASGSFTGAGFTVPAVAAAGPFTVTVTDAAGQHGSAVLAVFKPTLSAPGAGAAGSAASFSGTGWPAGDHAYAYLDHGTTATFFCTVYTDSTGALGPQSCTLPNGLTQGAYTLMVGDGAVSVSQPLTLNPGIVLTNTAGTAVSTAAVGDTVDLAGNGFTGLSTVTKVTVGTAVATTTPASPTVTASGSFSGATFIVPAVTKAGVYTVTVTDAASQHGSAALDVFKPTLTAPGAGAAGAVASLSGTGWPAGDHAYAYLDHGTTATFFCNVYTDSTGALGPQSCALPNGLTQGAYTLSVTDGAVSVTKAFTLDPGLVLTNASGTSVTTAAPGDTIDLAGNGFTGLSKITKVTVGTAVATTTPASPTVTASGSFSGATFVVPAVTKAGAYTVTVTDAAGQHGSAVLNLFKATLAAPAAAAAGASISLSGAAWPAGDHAYAYLEEGGTSTFFCNVYTDSTGVLGPQTCAAPVGLAQGAYMLVVSDGSVNVAQAFTLNPGVVVTNASGTSVTTAGVGDTVDLAGNGFTALSTIAKVTVGTATAALSPSAPSVAATGSFSGATFTVPAVAPGTYTVTVRDAAGKKGTVVLSVYAPTVTGPGVGASGAPFDLSGGGWPAADHLYAYMEQGTTDTFFCTVYTDSTGSLPAQACAVPSGLAQGAYTLLVTDGAVRESSAFTINPAISLTNTSSQPIASAAPGTTVDLSGTGFTASSTITKLAFGTTSVPISPAAPATSAAGAFSGESFKVPSLTPGTYTVTATDGSAKHGSVSFKIT